MNFEPTNYYNEDASKQHIRQLENNKDKMKIKIIAAKEIATAYQPIREHLQQEVRGMDKKLDQKEHTIAIGQAEVDRATKQFQSAAAAKTEGSMVQMEDETMMRNREIDIKLGQLSAERKALERQIRTLDIEHRSPTGQSRQKEREIEGEEEEEEDEEEAHSVPVTDHQCYDVCGASQSDVKLVEDMEALGEALADTEVQELAGTAMSQRAGKEQRLAEISLLEDGIRQDAKALADVDLQYAELKFGAKPAATRFDKLKGKMQAKLNQDVVRVERLQAELKRFQDSLETVERGVSNIYFRMSCVPVEGLSSASSSDSTDQLRDVRARVPTLLQRASEQTPEISGLDPDMVYSSHEELNSMESRDIKRPTTPIHTPQLSDEEECSPSHEKIKRCSSRLIESEQ
ncbi:coiled-coil domain-containing protein 183-like [Lycodopsis pacificus]